MNGTTTTLRALRIRSAAPRVLLYGAVLLLAVGGLRAALGGRPRTIVQAPRTVQSGPDYAALSFAEAFAREYLTWGAGPDNRAQRLAPFLSQSLSTGGGLTPGAKTSQTVSWTTVSGAHLMAGGVTVTIAAKTSNGLVYLAVPVVHGSRGLLAVGAYPAIVGAPPTDTAVVAVDGTAVDDNGLRTVVQRALTNYLAGSRTNLIADLTSSAVVSLPDKPLQVRSTTNLTWAQNGRTVNAQVTATDDHGTTWMLQYRLDVVHRDRWYVSSIEFNQGG
jgi:hypothetical protein